MKLILTFFIGLLFKCVFAQPLPKLSEYPQPNQSLIKKLKVKSVIAVIPSIADKTVIDTVQFFYNQYGQDTVIYENNDKNIYKTYEKDSHGKLSKVKVFYEKGNSFSLFETYTYIYKSDKSFKVVFMNMVWGTSDTGVYDRKGKLLYVQNGIDKMTYQYDKAGKLLRITSNKKSGVLPPVGSSFKYNSQGLVSSETFYMNRILYSYDSSGRLLKSQNEEKKFEAFCNCAVWEKTSAITYTYPP